MSSYFEFSFNVLLKEEKPHSVWEVLHAYQEISQHGSIQTQPSLPSEEFFADGVWEGAFGLETSFAGFPGCFFARLERSYQYTKSGTDYEFDSFSMRAVIHDDVYGSHFAFLDWLLPHCETQGFIGHEREELTPRPTLFYNFDSRLYRLKIEDNPRCIESNREYELD